VNPTRSLGSLELSASQMLLHLSVVTYVLGLDGEWLTVSDNSPCNAGGISTLQGPLASHCMSMYLYIGQRTRPNDIRTCVPQPLGSVRGPPKEFICHSLLVH
jgi:hypothetical protein